MSKILQKFQKLSQKTLLIIISILLVLLVTSGFLVYSYFDNSKANLSVNSSQISLNSNNSNSVISDKNSNSNPSSNSQTNSDNSNSISGFNISANNSNKSEKTQLETAILDECDLVINYNPVKYYVVESENIYNVGTKMEIREKNIATQNDSLLLYQCNFDNYKFANVSNELQKLFPSSNFKIPLFDKSFLDKTQEAGVIEFPGNVALRTKEEFPLDWFKIKNNPNFQAGIKTVDTRTIFHQMTFRNDPIIWNGQDLQFGLKNKETKTTKEILSPEEYKKLANEEENLDAKKVKKFQNFEKIKFEGKINKISDIPENLLDKYGIPQFGFRFYKGVVFWTGYRSNSQEFEDSLAKFEIDNVEKKEIRTFFNEGIIAYDGTNVVELRDENDKEIKNYFGSSIGTYYVSSLIKDGIGYNFGQGCGGWACNITPGFFIDFGKGEYWTNKNGITENNSLQDQKEIQPYLDYDFKFWNGTQPKIIGDTGYKIHKNGKIYGIFQKYTNQVKDGNPVSEGEFLVETDGTNYKFLYPSNLLRSGCANPSGYCTNNIIFNARGNFVYYGYWYNVENESPKEDSKEKIKMKFIEQDFATGKVLQEDISIKNDQILKKYGLTKIN